MLALNGALVGRVFDAAAAARNNPCFPLHPDYCPCSAGCTTTACPRCEGPKVGAGTWHCRPTHLCNASNSVDDAVAALPPTFLSATLRVTMLAFLAFRREHVRNAFKKKPHHWRKAYAREVNRIAYLADTARAAGTRLPLHVVVAGDRNRTTEDWLARTRGVGFVEAAYVEPPRWASRFHKQSFNKISALALTQFDKVIVLDNDVVLVKPLDALAAAEPPAAVFHTAVPRLDRCTVTTGLMVLAPSASEHARALRLLYEGMNYSTELADGGDQEFWHSFLPTFNELPIRYHAHVRLALNATEWWDVRMVHAIAQFAGRGWHIPKNITGRLRYF